MRERTAPGRVCGGCETDRAGSGTIRIIAAFRRDCKKIRRKAANPTAKNHGFAPCIYGDFAGRPARGAADLRNRSTPPEEVVISPLPDLRSRRIYGKIILILLRITDAAAAFRRSGNKNAINRKRPMEARVSARSAGRFFEEAEMNLPLYLH